MTSADGTVMGGCLSSLWRVTKRCDENPGDSQREEMRLRAIGT